MSKKSENWPEELCCDAVRAVPSYHCRPEFAQLVRQQINIFKPDLIAVELPDNVAEPVCRAVGFLPSISAVITPADEIIPITPEDSIIEAIRTALAEKIDLAFIDLETPEPDSENTEGNDFMADEAMLEAMDLPEFISLNAHRIYDVAQKQSFTRREEHMAGQLQKLSQKYQRILFICGMVHWKRIRNRMTQTNSCLSHQHGKGGAVAIISPEYLHKITGEIPYQAFCYEQNRISGDFSLKNWLTELFHAAARTAEITLNAGVLADLLRFSRNQAVLPGRLTPSLRMIVEAAAGIVDHDFAAHVHRMCLAYPAAGQPVESQLKIVWRDHFSLSGLPEKYVLKPFWRPVCDESGHSALPVDKRTAGRNHPFADRISRNPGRQFSEAWGRYAEEMDEEERFIDTLERWACHAGRSDEFVAREFCDGLSDGLDVRETIRDLAHGRFFVKEFTHEDPRFSAVLVEFADDWQAHGDPIYTYGRHKGLAFTSADFPNVDKPGTAARDHGILLSFKRLIDDNCLWQLYDQMVEMAWQRGFDQREILLKMAMMTCRAEELLIVAPQSSLSQYRSMLDQLVSGQSGSPCFLNRDKVWNKACERIRRFNIYYYL